jgi:hypothetical protein
MSISTAFREIWPSANEIRRVVLQAIARHGVAAEAYLNYPLQDRETPWPQKRLLRCALRDIRRLKRSHADENLSGLLE